MTKILDENSPILTLSPDEQEYGNHPSFIDYVSSDNDGDIFFTAFNSIYRYSKEGTLLQKNKFPVESFGYFYVNSSGQIYFPSKKGIVEYSKNFEFVQSINIEKLSSDQFQILKIESDKTNENLFIQVYSQAPLSQILYKLNLKNKNLTELFVLQNPVKFSPTYSPGAFDFAVGQKYLYVSDIHEYKIYVYDLENNQIVKVFNKNFQKQNIAAEDGKLILRNMTIGGIGKADTLITYPPILHINYTNSGKIIVCTSQRNSDLRQILHIYDEELNYLGTDQEYIHPELNTYNFINGKVYVPDYGFGKQIETNSISPMEIPNRPYSIKVYKESLY